MSKNILLARPYAFIVSKIKPFLEQNSYVAKKLDAYADLPANAAGVAGAIISLAVVSSIGESAEAVFTVLRKLTPRLPVLFASLINFATVKSTFERLLKNAGISANILGIDAVSESSPAMEKSDSFLFLSKDDLVSPDQRVLATRIIKRYFN